MRLADRKALHTRLNGASTVDELADLLSVLSFQAVCAHDSGRFELESLLRGWHALLGPPTSRRAKGLNRHTPGGTVRTSASRRRARTGSTYLARAWGTASGSRHAEPSDTTHGATSRRPGIGPSSVSFFAHPCAFSPGDRSPCRAR